MSRSAWTPGRVRRLAMALPFASTLGFLTREPIGRSLADLGAVDLRLLT